MAVIKIACPKCGQKVSGDETFYGRSVNCPICTSKIVFPQNPTPSTGPVPPSQNPVPPSQPPVETSPVTTPEPPAGAPPSHPDPATQGPPAFETIHPAQQPAPPSQPAFDTVISSAGPSFDEVVAKVPAPPETPPAHENEDVPSPLLGTLSLVVGILNTVSICVGGILLAPVAIILGHAALAKAKHSPVKPAPGQSLAMIGVILGYAGLVFTILLLIGLLAFKEPFLEAISRASEGA